MKTFGVIVVVVAVAGFAGVGTASASFCTGGEPSAPPCPAGKKIYASDFKGQLKTGVNAIWAGALEVKCKKSMVEGEIVNAAGEGKITALTFEECTTCPEVKPTLPIAFSGEPSELADGNGTLGVFNTKVLLSKCLGGSTNCTATAATVELDFVGGNPAELKAINEPVKLEGPFCGTKASWSATYVTSEPATGLWLY